MNSLSSFQVSQFLFLLSSVTTMNGITVTFIINNSLGKAFIKFFAFPCFYFVIWMKIDLVLLNITRSDFPNWIRRFVFISISQRFSLSHLQEMILVCANCIYLSVQILLLARSSWIAFPIQSCLVWHSIYSLFPQLLLLLLLLAVLLLLL